MTSEGISEKRIKNEIWEQIEDTNYFVSNFGRIYNGNRNRLLNPVVNGNRYKQVYINKKILSVHRLVASAFLERVPLKDIVNHKDGDRGNNNVENIEWCTASENAKHAYDVLGVVPRLRGLSGGDHPKSRKVVQATFSGDIVRVWDCAMDAVRDGNFDSSCISRCCRKEYKKHNGYRWFYAD